METLKLIFGPYFQNYLNIANKLESNNKNRNNDEYFILHLESVPKIIIYNIKIFLNTYEYDNINDKDFLLNIAPNLIKNQLNETYKLRSLDFIISILSFLVMDSLLRKRIIIPNTCEVSAICGALAFCTSQDEEFKKIMSKFDLILYSIEKNIESGEKMLLLLEDDRNIRKYSLNKQIANTKKMKIEDLNIYKIHQFDIKDIKKFNEKFIDMINIKILYHMFLR